MMPLFCPKASAVSGPWKVLNRYLLIKKVNAFLNAKDSENYNLKLFFFFSVLLLPELSKYLWKQNSFFKETVFRGSHSGKCWWHSKSSRRKPILLDKLGNIFFEFSRILTSPEVNHTLIPWPELFPLERGIWEGNRDLKVFKILFSFLTLWGN